MPIIGSKGAESSQGFGQFALSTSATYIEDVFSTYLYTGNSTTGGTQTITNNIDLSTKGGMVWIKGRSAASNHILTDTTRGAGTSATNNNAIASNLATAEDLGGSSYDYLSSFSTTGFVVTQGGTTTATRGTNYNAVTYAAWTFRKQPKFFDVVTYNGDQAPGHVIQHNLGSTPGCIMIKDTGGANNWRVWHRSLSAGQTILLNDSGTPVSDNAIYDVTSTSFTLSNVSPVNFGSTYVAYLFAHNAGGFGLTGTDNVISCGSVGSNPTTVNLGWEPQWLLIKPTGSPSDWYLMDNMRGIFVDSSGQGYVNFLAPNNSSAENAGNYIAGINSTGFTWTFTSPAIYIAIRRGPMKTPTSGTSVFGLNARTGTAANATVTGGQVADTVLIKNRGAAVADLMSSRLTGTGYLVTSSTAAEVAAGTTILQANPWDVMDGVKVGTTSTITNATSNTFINYLFRRAPGFFDEVCYTGTGVARTVAHNLTVVPELMIVKTRALTGGGAGANWAVYHSAVGNTKTLFLDATNAASTASANWWNNTTPTSSVFTVGIADAVNASATALVAYLFASCPGVSKVGSYTGTGTTKQIDCGFTGGARFVLIKRTDSTGDWYVWDSARGIVAGNDPYLLLNSTAAEVTTTDYVDTYSAGFEISSTAPAAINANGGTFIYLAIA